MQRWAIALDDEVLQRLKQEHLELGSEVVSPDGTRLLLFRDRFVALRVALVAGTRPVPYLEEPVATAV